MQNKVYIVRHGETEWNKLGKFQGSMDSPVTENGKRQAAITAKKLLGKQITTIFSSPLPRAIITAQIISEILHTSVIVEPSFTEMHYGLLEGVEKERAKKVYSEFYHQRKSSAFTKVQTPYPQGESYMDVYKRIKAPVLDLIKQNSNFVIVGHNSVNRIIRAVILERKLEEMVHIQQVNNELIEIDVLAKIETMHII